MRSLVVFVLAFGVLSGCAAPGGQYRTSGGSGADGAGVNVLRYSAISGTERDQLCSSYGHSLGC